jgi:hypothetical protein
MSACPPKAAQKRTFNHFGLVPKAAVSNRSRAASLFDHLVGAGEQRVRPAEAEHAGDQSLDDQIGLPQSKTRMSWQAILKALSAALRGRRAALSCPPGDDAWETSWSLAAVTGE